MTNLLLVGLNLGSAPGARFDPGAGSAHDAFDPGRIWSCEFVRGIVSRVGWVEQSSRVRWNRFQYPQLTQAK